MDGRTDLSEMQMHRGMRPKIYFDKEMEFVKTPTQLPTLVSRGVEHPPLLIDQLHTIQNYKRDAASFTPSDHVRRGVSNAMEGKPFTPLSRKTLYTIHKTGNPEVEMQLIRTSLHYNALLRDQIPDKQWENTLETSGLIRQADYILETQEERIDY